MTAGGGPLARCTGSGCTTTISDAGTDYEYFEYQVPAAGAGGPQKVVVLLAADSLAALSPTFLTGVPGTVDDVHERTIDPLAGPAVSYTGVEVDTWGVCTVPPCNLQDHHTRYVGLQKAVIRLGRTALHAWSRPSMAVPPQRFDGWLDYQKKVDPFEWTTTEPAALPYP